MTIPPRKPSADALDATVLSTRLTADHGVIDRLFLDAMAALDGGRPAEAHKVLDRIWMRLAVHIRAEHKAVFPALAQARPELQGKLQSLHEDHDYFMRALAGAVKALAGPSPEVASVKPVLEAVRSRLGSHNTLEEETIYPTADQLPREQRGQVEEGVSRELAFLPKRHGWTG